MEPNEKLKKILEVENVLGYAYINAEDGSIIQSGGITPGNVDEIVAFIGSASDIISKTFKLYPYRVIRLEGKDKILIFKFQDNYLGCVLDELKEETEKRIVDLITQEDLTGDPAVFKVLRGKARQISLLLEEFSVGSEREKWEDLVKKAIVALDRDNKFTNLIFMEGLQMKVKGAIGLTKDEVNKYMKLLLDFIVKEAIKEFGAEDAKRRVHSVIEKLSGEKK